MFVVWVLPIGVVGFYDLLQGQGYLQNYPKISEVLPLWVYWFWLGIGVLAFIVVTFEGAYRISQKRLKQATIKDTIGIVARHLITVENYDYEFITCKDAPEYKKGSITIRLNPEIHATPGVAVEDIQLELKGRRYDTDWEPMEETISGDIGHYVYAHLEKSFKPGKYQAYIVAIIKGKEHPSDAFTINFPKSICGTEDC